MQALAASIFPTAGARCGSMKASKTRWVLAGIANRVKEPITSWFDSAAAPLLGQPIGI